MTLADLVCSQLYVVRMLWDMMSKENLPRRFKKIIRRLGISKERKIISAKLRELEPTRNAIAHVRELNRVEVQKLKLYSEDIILCVEKEDRRTTT